MKNTFVFCLIGLFLLSCNVERKSKFPEPLHWENRTVKGEYSDSMTKGSTYLSVFSKIYSQTELSTHKLTTTISMRNVNRKDTVFIDKAEFFDTKGKSVRSYFDETIFIAPLETVEIVIDATDQAGGTGANFIFDWSVKPGLNEPFFDAVMISTSGQQGISFTTHGYNIK